MFSREKDFTICFEIFSKKMKTVIKAASKKEAESKLRDKIKIYSIEDISEARNPVQNASDIIKEIIDDFSDLIKGNKK